MAWITITNNPLWEYDNAPADPGGSLTYIWSKQTNGIRTSTFDGTEIYTNCRMVGTTVDAGELNKTYWDAQ